jgi:hypothetical protein
VSCEKNLRKKKGGGMIISNFRGSWLLFFNNPLDSSIIKFPKYICIILLFCFLALFIGKESYSQNEKPPEADALVTVFFVKETEACPPNGYPSNYDSSDEKRYCEKLDLEKLKILGKPVADSVPPERIPLGYIEELVDDYRKDCPLKDPCKDPNDRYSIVLAFEFKFKPTKGVDVTLERQIPDHLQPHFGEHGNYRAKGTLDHGGHWINHQRADLFLPGYDVKWELTAGGHSWTLGTKDPVP